MIKKIITITVLAALLSSCGMQKKMATHQNEINNLTQQVATLEKENKNLKANIGAFEEQQQEFERHLNEIQGGEDAVMNPEDRIALNYAEIMPKFDAEVSIDRFFKANYKKPKNMDEGISEGIVYVQFVVEQDGRVNKIKVVRPVHKELDKEAKRLVKLTKWIPGTIRQETVRVKMVLPVSFK